MLISSIQAMGLMNPIIVDEDDVILSGHLRVEAFEALGWPTIQAYRVSHLSRDQKAAFVISANRLVELGDWDKGMLSLEFEMLADISSDLDLTISGFEMAEIDLIIGSDDSVADEPPIPARLKKAITRPGDVWLLGKHRLLCGNSLEVHSWSQVMQGETARLCLTDPPYNVRIRGHVSSGNHREFSMASGEMSSTEFADFLRSAMSCAVNCTIDGGLHLIAMDHRHLRELYTACDPLYGEQLNLIVWAKNNAGMGSLYRSRHELFALYKVGTAPHVNNIQLGKFGRNRSNVWHYPGANTFRKGRDKDLADHPTVKPLALVADALLDLTNINDVVIDGFGGSGTLILAAEQTRRRARVIELDPLFCDVAVRRWEEMTGRNAIRQSASATEMAALPHTKVLLLPAPENGEVQ
jgi:DNA modification methylase